jgi:hypothetical protein
MAGSLEKAAASQGGGGVKTHNARTGLKTLTLSAFQVVFIGNF